MVELLESRGDKVLVLDNLSTGNACSVKLSEIAVGDLLDYEFVRSVFRREKIDKVFHFAAKSLVADSQKEPLKYYEENLLGSINLLKVMIENAVERIVFSSSAAVYGDGTDQAIFEDSIQEPINPYGETKKIVEKMLADLSASGKVSSVSFRYFNAAGASQFGTIGEAHFPETHLIPRILNSAFANQESEISIFGNDYETFDGTCVRDYVHVEDICHAHLQGMEFLSKNNGAHVFNIGAGEGYSVLDVIDVASKVTERNFRPKFMPRRPGDPARLVADISKIKLELGWQPQQSGLDSIIRSAWDWHRTDKYRQMIEGSLDK
jgi:UDP-glucose 4-epimerase